VLPRIAANPDASDRSTVRPLSTLIVLAGLVHFWPMPAHDMSVRERLIVALDYPNAASARDLISRLGDSVQTYKVGKQLFTAEGPQ
jgi:hypothetical protein